MKDLWMLPDGTTTTDLDACDTAWAEYAHDIAVALYGPAEGLEAARVGDQIVVSAVVGFQRAHAVLDLESAARLLVVLKKEDALIALGNHLGKTVVANLLEATGKDPRLLG